MTPGEVVLLGVLLGALVLLDVVDAEPLALCEGVALCVAVGLGLGVGKQGFLGVRGSGYRYLPPTSRTTRLPSLPTTKRVTGARPGLPRAGEDHVVEPSAAVMARMFVSLCSASVCGAGPLPPDLELHSTALLLAPSHCGVSSSPPSATKESMYAPLEEKNDVGGYTLKPAGRVFDLARGEAGRAATRACDDEEDA